MKALAGDLIPMAVLINKALIEIPPRFAGKPPVNPEARKRTDYTKGWKGAEGLAEDVRYYGKWMRDTAERRIGHPYPKYKITEELLEKRPDLKKQGLKPGDELTVIAWLWARTVTCPNPACGARMPLVRSFWLSKKKGKEAYMEPVIDRSEQPPRVRFEVRVGKGIKEEGTVNRRGARCIVCNTPVPFKHIREEGKAGRMDTQLMAVVAEGPGGRVYLPPVKEHEVIAFSAQPNDVPDTYLPEKALGFRVQLYGMRKHKDLFTNRQLVALTTFSDLVAEARERCGRTLWL